MADKTLADIIGQLNDLHINRLEDIRDALEVLAHGIETANIINQPAWFRTLNLLAETLETALADASVMLQTAENLAREKTEPAA